MGVAISVLSPVGTVVQMERSIVFVRGALGEENLNVVLLGLALTHAPWTRRSLTNERVFEKTQTLRRGETEHNGFGVKFAAKSLDGDKMAQ